MTAQGVVDVCILHFLHTQVLAVHMLHHRIVVFAGVQQQDNAQCRPYTQQASYKTKPVWFAAAKMHERLLQVNKAKDNLIILPLFKPPGTHGNADIDPNEVFPHIGLAVTPVTDLQPGIEHDKLVGVRNPFQ